MMLKPQDVLILLSLAVRPRDVWSYGSLASDLFMSASEVHAGVKRAVRARLLDMDARMPRVHALEELCIHGVKYVYPPDVGTLTRGVPTMHSCPALREAFGAPRDEWERYVWPHPEGTERGLALSPLYASAPDAAARDDALYSAMCLLDGIRFGRAREQKIASKLLAEMLHNGSVHATA